MFTTYLRRELRRRMRQSVLISVGLALGIGLVITVSAVSAGVAGAQGAVLHSLYGIGTDITVTHPPVPGSGAAPGFGFGLHKALKGARSSPGTRIDVSVLRSRRLGMLAASSATAISRLPGVAAAAGGLTLTDMSLTGTIPSLPAAAAGGAGQGRRGLRAFLTPAAFGVEGVAIGQGELGPLSSGKLVSGSTLTAADSGANVAVIDTNFAAAQKLGVGSAITVGGTRFKVIGIVAEPQGSNPSDVYIPLARAQALAGAAWSGKVNSIFVAADSASQIGSVSAEIARLLPGAAVTNSSNLAGEVTGSLASAASLAGSLGRWLAIAVLAAAFLLASLLTMSAVARRVREFGTLKALGWRGRRIVGQVMGEALVTGIAGGLAGIALGLGGAALVGALAPPLSASAGLATGSATPGGARAFGAGRPHAGGGPGGFRRLAAAGHSVTVHLTAPVTLTVVLLAVGLALLGSLIAGSFGAWRVARLRPTAALSRVE
jgi:ABC-type lipoprotein release transport system permease subunit